MSTTEASNTDSHDLTFKIGVTIAYEPGFGSILRELRQARGWTQDELGIKAGKDRSTIALYESEQRKPPRSELHKILLLLNVDRVILRKHFGNPFSDEKVQALLKRATDSTVAAVDLAETLLDMKNAPLAEIEDSIWEYAKPKWDAALALKGITGDVKALALGYERFDKRQEEKRLEGSGTSRNVTPAQASAVDGSGVYVDPVVVPPVVVDDGTKAP